MESAIKSGKPLALRSAGPARNELLRSAHSKFDKTLTLFEEASKTSPDPQIEKLMEKTSMLMYGTLKYQSL